ncbi:HIT family protein [Sphingomonas sp. ID0503]|uniref:HIT family protein n=1 Tax=Sphingomonas sp. ID0503 TaxID=3399691 RepID=UPI003AFB67FA
MNATIHKFGWPGTLIAEYTHWMVLLRPQAVTLGSLVIAAKSPATAFGALPVHAFTEQAQVIADVETALGRSVGPEKMNYLMLMMVDPHVHFHAFPRYDGVRTHGELEIADAGWPKTPDLGSAVMLSEAQVADQVAWLKAAWPG